MKRRSRTEDVVRTLRATERVGAVIARPQKDRVAHPTPAALRRPLHFHPQRNRHVRCVCVVVLFFSVSRRGGVDAFALSRTFAIKKTNAPNPCSLTKRDVDCSVGRLRTSSLLCVRLRKEGKQLHQTTHRDVFVFAVDDHGESNATARTTRDGAGVCVQRIRQRRGQRQPGCRGAAGEDHCNAKRHRPGDFGRNVHCVCNYSRRPDVRVCILDAPGRWQWFSVRLANCALRRRTWACADPHYKKRTVTWAQP